MDRWILLGRNYYPHFADEETDAQRVELANEWQNPAQNQLFSAMKQYEYSGLKSQLRCCSQESEHLGSFSLRYKVDKTRLAVTILAMGS